MRFVHNKKQTTNISYLQLKTCVHPLKRNEPHILHLKRLQSPLIHFH